MEKRIVQCCLNRKLNGVNIYYLFAAIIYLLAMNEMVIQSHGLNIRSNIQNTKPGEPAMRPPPSSS